MISVLVQVKQAFVVNVDNPTNIHTQLTAYLKATQIINFNFVICIRTGQIMQLTVF